MTLVQMAVLCVILQHGQEAQGELKRVCGNKKVSSRSRINVLISCLFLDHAGDSRCLTYTVPRARYERTVLNLITISPAHRGTLRSPESIERRLV